MHEFVVKYDMAEAVEEESLMRGVQGGRKKKKEEENGLLKFLTIASINYIVLATRQYRLFNGIDFSNQETWELCKQAINEYIRVLFENILI